MDPQSHGLTLSLVDGGGVAQVQGLLRGHFGAGYYGADDRFLRWFYFDSPYKTLVARADQYSILAFTDAQGAIQAMDAFLPWKMYCHGREAVGVWDIEWMNVSGIRGLGRQLVGDLRRRCDVYCGYGMNEMSNRAFAQLGFHVTDEIDRRVAIVDAQACGVAFAPFAVQGQDEFLRDHAVGDLALAASPAVIRDLGLVSDAFWLDHCRRCPVTSIKDAVALRWRYVSHPTVAYTILSLDGRGGGGLAVVRVEAVKNSPWRVLRILELLPVSGAERDLALAVLRFARDAGCLLADFFCSSSRIADMICVAPFVSLQAHRRFGIPMRFQPMEVRSRRSINLVLDSDRQRFPIEAGDLYATKGDGDQDVQVNPDYVTVSI